MSSVKFNCRVCAFPLTRKKEDLDKDCPKCFKPKPYVPATTQAAAAVTAKQYSASSAMESESGVCTKSPTGQHTWKFGKCSACSKPEGKLVKGTGSFANPGGKAACSNGGKHVYQFAVCKVCGQKEY